MNRQPFESMPDVMDAKQIAEALQISKAGAYNLLNSPDFPTLRIGGRKLVMKNGLLEWLKSHTNRNMPLLDTRRGKDLMGTFLSDIVLQVLSFVAENERTNIRQRQAEGIAAAKAKGVKFGRPPLPLPENFYEIHKAWREKKITLKEAAEACKMPVGTFYGKARKFENAA